MRECSPPGGGDSLLSLGGMNAVSPLGDDAGMSNASSIPAHARSPRDRLIVFFDRLIPLACNADRNSGSNARLWLAQSILGILVVLAAGFIGNNVIGISMGLLLGETTEEAVAQADQGSALLYPVGFLIGSVITAVLALAGYWGLMRLLRGRPVSELSGPRRLRELGAGLGWGTGTALVLVAILAVAGAYRVTSVGWDSGILVGLGSGIAAGIAEELLFRGILLRLLEAWSGTWWALALTSALFGARHLLEGVSPIGAVLIALNGGALLGACYLVTRRLWLAIGLHMAANFVQGGVFGLSLFGIGNSLLHSRLTGPAFLTGGGIGIDGSPVNIIVCAAVSAIMLVVAHRRGLIVPPVWRRRQA